MPPLYSFPTLVWFALKGWIHGEKSSHPTFLKPLHLASGCTRPFNSFCDRKWKSRRLPYRAQCLYIFRFQDDHLPSVRVPTRGSRAVRSFICSPCKDYIGQVIRFFSNVVVMYSTSPEATALQWMEKEQTADRKVLQIKSFWPKILESKFDLHFSREKKVTCSENFIKDRNQRKIRCF